MQHATFLLRTVAGVGLLGLMFAGCTPPATNRSSQSSPTGAAALQRPSEPLALTPPMGFNNWNAFGCDVNEALIQATADLFVSSGLKDAGYEYVNIDDCWSLRERGADGKLVPDPVKFPSGIRGVAEYVHARGLKLGIYGDAGTKTCAGYPGSLGKENIDAQTWADWGVDYVKYDNCYNQTDGSRADYVRRYTAMREAIDATGRPMVYSICEWGESQPWEWAPGVGQLWRTTGDISDNWSSVRAIIAFNAKLSRHAGPGRWNDPDMLEVGNGGMTLGEYRTHMSLWAMMAAPLIIGTDLRKASAETFAILKNREIIELDQDPLGKQADVVADAAGRMLFAKPLSNGEVAVALYNSTDSLVTVSAPARDAGLPEAKAYRLHDVWRGVATHAGTTFSAGVPAHGAIVYRVSPVDDARELPPSVAVAATLPTLIPSVPGGATLTASATNGGTTAASAVAFSVEAPRGWSVKPLDAGQGASIAPAAATSARFRIEAPPDTAAGSYTLSIQATYTWGERREPFAVATELGAVVVVPPPDGVTQLSRLAAVSSSSALGPFERDMANGDAAEGDGDLITLGGKVYTRGIGTRAPSEIVFYLGGRCSSLSTEVGLDDSLGTPGAASFKIFADDRLVAESGLLRPEDPPRALDAKLTGATWLKLVTALGEASYGPVAPTDWARPLLTCGKSKASTAPELIVDSFESGTEGVALKNAAVGGTFEISKTFATHGANGLSVTTPPDGNWFGRSFAAPLDLRGKTALAFDVKTGSVGTVGELAVELGADKTWCQGGHWAWVNPGSTKTIKTKLDELRCPAGKALDPEQITGVWVFLKSAVTIDQVRAE